MKNPTRLNNTVNLLTFVCFLLFTTLSIPSRAQNKKETKKDAKQEKPHQEGMMVPEGAKKLYAFLGNWRGTIDGKMSGKEMHMTTQHQYSKAVDGWGLKMNETMNLGEGKKYTALNLLGYDAGENMYHIYTIDNTGSVHDHKGKWEGNTISLQHNGIVDGKPYEEKIWLEIKSPTEYVMKWEGKLGGEVVEGGTGTMRKEMSEKNEEVKK